MNYVHFMERFVSLFLVKSRILTILLHSFIIQFSIRMNDVKQNLLFWVILGLFTMSLFLKRHHFGVFCCPMFILCHITLNLNYLKSAFHVCKSVHNNIQYHYAPNITLNLLVLVLDNQSSHRFLSNPYLLHSQEQYATSSPSSRL